MQVETSTNLNQNEAKLLDKLEQTNDLAANFRPDSNPSIDTEKRNDALHTFDLNPTNPLYNKDRESLAELNKKPSPDKQINNNKKQDNSTWAQWMKIIHWADHYSCISNIIANSLGAFSMLTSMPETTKKTVEKLVNFITTLSYVPYGLSGMNQGIEKKNIFQTLGFAAEAIMPWLGNLKDIYLIRGLDTGINQVWEYCDRTESKDHKDGYFTSFGTGFTGTLKTCWQLLKEIFQDPISTINPVKYSDSEKKWNFDPSGHNGLLSTILDVAASLGYLITGKEKIFGPLRDLGSWLFDLELAFQNNPKKRSSGILFIIEATLDFVARYLNNNSMRLFVNMLSHASGRIALMLYKNSDKAAEKITTPDK